MPPTTLKPGDVVSCKMRGVVAAKYRPGIVISTVMFQSQHADVIVALVTSQLHQATTATDYIPQDWAAAGLRVPSAVRLYLETVDPLPARWIGQLTEHDWQEVQARLRLGLAVT
jgi:mRNA-degrading endonuclease toxin of MazEF toxin-antitoxin module